MTNWRRPSALSPALLAIIAVVGVGVLTLVLLLALNLFNSPGPTSSARPTSPTTRTDAPATAQPGASATAQPTNSTAAPATDAPQTAPPSAAGSLTPEQALLAHVPEPIRAACTVEDGRGPVVLAARCSADDGVLTVNYYQYGSADDMAAEFGELRDASQIEPATGSCEDQQTWPAESVYSVGGQITGRRLCTEVPGLPTIYWTDDRLNIMGQAVTESESVERLVEFWTNESGPIP